MEDNDNVVIYTEEKESMRSILKILLDYLGVKVVLTEKSIEIQGPISNELMTSVIRKVIMEERTQVVTIKIENNQEKTKSQEIDLEKKVYYYIREKEHVKFKEVKEKFGLESTKVTIILNSLKAQNLIKNVCFGYWELVKTKEAQILELLTNGWIMSEEEIAVKVDIELDEVSNILEKMREAKEIKKVEGGYKIEEDLFGVFKQDEYKILLDFILSRSRFSIGQIKSKFPEEFPKLSELMEKITPKYIREVKDSPGTYQVHVKGRVLYFIMNHENATFSYIKASLPMLSSQEVSNAITIALREGELELNKKGGHKVIKMV